jgi:hydrocephalus-inducing protein
MEVSYTVTFTPGEVGVHETELVCMTDREKFVIPVRSLGARGKPRAARAPCDRAVPTCRAHDAAVLELPSNVAFPCAPANHPSAHPFMLRNVGTVAATFAFAATPPFSVEPATGQLGAASHAPPPLLHVSLRIAR